MGMPYGATSRGVVCVAVECRKSLEGVIFMVTRRAKPIYAVVVGKRDPEMTRSDT